MSVKAGQAHGQEAGRSAAEAIRAWWQELRAARRPSEDAAPNGGVDLRDPAGTIVHIGDHPLEAYERLLEIDWSRHEGRMLMWDDEYAAWRPVEEQR